MNPLLGRLHAYPFERLRALTRDITPNPAYRPISLGIGEPRHPAPALVEKALCASLAGLSSYPATAGEPSLREAIAAWVARRYGVSSWANTRPPLVRLSDEQIAKLGPILDNADADFPA